jgi:asparagine synthase (glutamine-hydrolysing)
MTETLVHRGPDAKGLWLDENGRCVLGHRRLSIIDTSEAGLQPMATRDGRYVLSYNGELYNYLEIRSDLTARGVQFRGRTDTEVVLEAFALWGTDALKRFDGMFAFAVFDTLTGELVLARDSFGEKPLYYSRQSDGSFAFASELQALELAPGIDLTVSVDAMAEMLTFQYIGAPRSIYGSVKKLRPGHWLKIDASGQTQLGRYFAFRPGLGGYTDRSTNDLADELEALLVKSIEHRMLSDVPLGAFLSGGVDSSTVCALIRRRLNRPLMTFSLGFDGAPESEHLVARTFAQHLGTEHHDKIIAPSAAEFLLDFGAILDEPNGDSSCLPTNLLSGFAREHVTVAISGDGGDEMFGGYGRYMTTLSQLRQYDNGDLPGWKPGSSYYGNQILVASEPHIEELFGFVPQKFADHVGLLRTELDEAQANLLAAMRRSDVDNYLPGAVLPKVDRMSMRHSLEVRTPFLNVDIARFAEQLPESVLVEGSRGKLLLKEIAYRYLPRELVDLPKQGFALPMSDWAKDSLLGIAATMLESEDSRLRESFGSEGIAKFMGRQRSPGNFAAYQVWGVVALESWLRHHPAVMPSLAEGPRLPASRAHGRKTPDRFALYALPLRSDVYLVARGDAAEVIDHEIEARFRSLPPQITIHALQLLAEAASPGELTAPLRLNDWNGSAGILSDDARKMMRGATLLFVDPDACLQIGLHTIEELRDAGVSGLAVTNPYIDGELLALTLRPQPSATALMKLFRRRKAMLSAAPAARLLGATRLKKIDGAAFESSVVRSVEAFPDLEMATDYMVFEGQRQLPPLPLSHHVIAERGDGRYSVFDQLVTLAPSTEGSGRGLFWMVRAADVSPDQLPTTVRRLHHNVPLTAAAAAQVTAALLRRPASGETLRPGDPIVVCTHALPPGGAERQWVYLAEALQAAGYDVTFVTFRGADGVNGHFLPLLQRSGIKFYDASTISPADQLKAWPKSPAALQQFKLPLIPDREAVARLVAAFTQLKPKAVITQLDDPNLIGGMAAQIADVPIHVMSFRNYNPSNFPYIDKDWYRPAYAALCQSPRVLLAGNHIGANHDYADWIGIDSARVAYIPNAIDTAAFTRSSEKDLARVRENLGIPEGTRVILGVSRLSAEKDPMTFLEVCARVLAEEPETRAVLMGVGPLRAQLEEKIETHGLGGRIHLLGASDNVSLMMSLATLFLLTSRFEGMPNVVLEAQSVGIPVVATSAGATAELIEDGVSGFVRAIGDVDALAAACLTLVRAPARARDMGRAGRGLMQAKYNKQRLGASYIALLEQRAPQELHHGEALTADGPV